MYAAPIRLDEDGADCDIHAGSNAAVGGEFEAAYYDRCTALIP
jgi:hypothetical protein